MEKLEQYKLFLLREGKSPATITRDLSILKPLINTIPFNNKGVENHILKLLEKGRKPNYLNGIISVFRGWGRFEGNDEFNNIKFVKTKETAKATMSDKEIEDFLNLPPSIRGYKDWEKYTLFFKIMAYSGMRGGEAKSLIVSQVDLGRKLFILERTKTIPRLVPMPLALVDDLTEHIRKLTTEELFIMNGEVLTRARYRMHFRRRLKRMGIKRSSLSPHSLRHSFITRLLTEDVNIFKVQRIVGHKNISTTNRYTHLVTKDLTEAIAKDPLSRQNLTYDTRFKQFREGVRKLISDLSLTIDEEEQMIADYIKT